MKNLMIIMVMLSPFVMCCSRECKINQVPNVIQKTTAHVSNTCSEFVEGISQGVERLEGDVNWVRNNKLIMQHGFLYKQGIYLIDWLKLVNRYNRVAKIDIKSSSIVSWVIDDVEGANFPQDKLEINADVVMGPGSQSFPWYYKLGRKILFGLWDVSPVEIDDLKYVRWRLPNVLITIGTINYSKDDIGYSEKCLEEMISYSKWIGGKISFSLQAKWVDQHVVDKLKPYGRIDIWNDPDVFKLNENTYDYFLDIGVNGYIDLR